LKYFPVNWRISAVFKDVEIKKKNEGRKEVLLEADSGQRTCLGVHASQIVFFFCQANSFIHSFIHSLSEYEQVIIVDGVARQRC